MALLLAVVSSTGFVGSSQGEEIQQGEEGQQGEGIEEGGQEQEPDPGESKGAPQEPEPFSRARWMERHQELMGYPEAPRPALESAPLPPPIPTDFFVLSSTNAFVDPGVTSPVRVNNDLLAPGGGTNPWSQAEPDLDVNPFNELNILAGYQESRFRDGGARTLNFATSMDGGLTWTEGSLPQITREFGGPWERASDPWVAFGPDNRAYYVSLDFHNMSSPNQVGVSVSTDGGLTWGPPVRVFHSEIDFNDKEAIEVDTHPGSPHFGTVYVAWDINIREEEDLASQHLVVSRSTDGGASYRGPVVLRTRGGNIGAIPRVGPDGTLYIMWAGSFPGQGWFIFLSTSDDGGVSFTTPRAIQALSSQSVPFIRDGSILPSMAVDRASGDLYLVWADSRWTGVDQTTISYSRDKGQTWSAPTRVSDGPGDAPTFTAAVAVNGLGEVAVSYTSLENDPARAFLVDQYLSISRNRGVSFEPRRRLSPVTSDIRWAAWAREFFLGDYTGIAAGSRKFHVLWVFPLLPPPFGPVAAPGRFFGFDPPIGIDVPLPVAPFRLQSDVFFSSTR